MYPQTKKQTQTLIQKCSSVFAFILLSFSLCTLGSSAYANDEEITKILSQLSPAATMTTRLEQISETFLGRPYAGGCLGEGKLDKFDNDPLYRTDQFDCTTFVETVLAMALSKDLGTFQDHMNRIRYKDAKRICFVGRNHMPCLDWVGNNCANGILKDITKSIAGEMTAQAEAKIDKKAWYQKKQLSAIKGGENNTLPEGKRSSLLVELQALGSHFKPQVSTIFYVPLTALFSSQKIDASDAKADSSAASATAGSTTTTATATATAATSATAGSTTAISTASDVEKVNFEILNQIPSGAIINIVRPNWDLERFIGTRLNISHQGLAIRKKSVLYLRHASSEPKVVVDEPFLEYFKKFRNSPTIKGFNVLAVVSK